MSRVPTIGRRAALHGALGACAGLAFAPFTWRAHAADAIQTARVTDKLAVLSGGGGNVLALSTGDGLVVVDSGAAASGAPLVAALAALPNGARVHTLFNTHWHLEQIGSNETLGTRGRAHRRARENATAARIRLLLAEGRPLPEAGAEGSATRGDLLHDGRDQGRRRADRVRLPARGAHGWRYLRLLPRPERARRRRRGVAAARSRARLVRRRLARRPRRFARAAYSSSAMRARRSCQAMDR